MLKIGVICGRCRIIKTGVSLFGPPGTDLRMYSEYTKLYGRYVTLDHLRSFLHGPKFVLKFHFNRSNILPQNRLYSPAVCEINLF